MRTVLLAVLTMLLPAYAVAQSAPPEGTYACNAFSFGQQVLARHLKIHRNGTYDHEPIGGERSDWGKPGNGRYTPGVNGAPVFRDGPLEGAKVEGYTSTGTSSRFSLQGLTDPRATTCFGPAYPR